MRIFKRQCIAGLLLVALLSIAGAQDQSADEAASDATASPESTSPEAASPAAESAAAPSLAAESAATENSAAPAASESSAALEALQSNEPVTFSGTLISTLGGAEGWPLNPITTHLANTGKVLGFSMNNILSFDARPDPDFRVHGSTDVQVSPGLNMNIDEVFFDYSLKDAVFIRGGQQALSWDNSRIFGTGDLLIYPNLTPVSTTPPSWIAVKAYAPIGSDGITAVALEPSGSTVSLTTIMYAVKGDLAFGKFELTGEGLYRPSGELDYSVYAKTSIFDIDLYAQAFGSWTPGSGYSVSTLENVYWESTSPGFKIYFEHWYNDAGSSSYTKDNRLGLGSSWTPDENLGIKLGLLWTHALLDSSGLVMPFITYQPRSYITFTLGAIGTYGAIGSTYASALPPGYSFPFPWDEKYSVFAKVDLSMSY